VLRRDPEGVAAFIERMKCALRFLRGINRKMGNPFTAADVEDLSQDTLVVALQRLPWYRGRSPLEAWVYRICGFEFLNALRKKQRRERLSDRDLTRDPGAGAAAGGSPWQFEEVYRALERLAPPEAEVVRLKHFEDLTFREIGETLAVSESTVKTRYYKALALLQSWLSPSYEDLPS
jgi:RNA polymerase sigma-70 factor (ECF subfamily)